MQKRILEEAPCHVPYRSFRTHFFDAAKKATSEQRCIGYLYTCGSENASKKIEKKWNGVPEGSQSRPLGRSKTMAFKKDFARREGSSGRVAGTAQVLTLLVASVKKSPHIMEASS